MAYLPSEYHRRVFKLRRLYIDPKLWPQGVPFANLSTLTGRQLIKLHAAVSNCRFKFSQVSDKMLRDHVSDPAGVLPTAFIEELGLSYPGRCDQKKSRFDVNNKPVSNKRRLRTKGAITPKRIPDDSDRDS